MEQTRKTVVRWCAAAAAAAAIVASTPQLAIAAPTTSGTSVSWTQKQIAAQLKRLPGGTATGNSVHYAKGDVTLTYTPTAKAGIALPMTFSGCNAGQVCLYSGSTWGTVSLSTTSIWCPGENGMGRLLDLNDYGLYGNVRSADSENGYWTQAEYDYWDWTGMTHYVGVQWTMPPQGDVSNESPTHVGDVAVCANSNHLLRY
ncbi:hypothetical protein ABT095_37640 [Kitasatospora sp. NPDC002227]|uniref:hypothetical protein n=1 Tax=Kitasatospora sp. NPDC002227 TaxID=3154773 RepID=UPI00332914D3